MNYLYPIYRIDFTRQMLDECCRVAVRLVVEEGMVVRHDRFLDAIRGKPGVTIDGERVRFDNSLVEAALQATIEKERKLLQNRQPRDLDADDWVVDTGGYSITTLDPVTDQVRPATCDDLRAFIRIVDSYGLGGPYPVAPQDVPPLMRAVAVFKICWESSEKVRPWDYMNIRQIPFLYEMHRVMGRPFPIHICIPQPMGIDEHTLEYFLSMYETWKRNGDMFLTVGDYPMLGISKPISSTGCLTIMLANRLAAHLLFKSFDPEVELGISMSAGQTTDLRAVCWAWGSPRGHLYRYLDSRIWPVLCGVDVPDYAPRTVLLESNSCAIDAQAAMEKMATCLLAAMQGVRHFRGAGSLCVDDLYSPVQFVMDVEIVRFIREMIESFDPHADVLATDGLYELCRDCVRGDEYFVSHPDTVSRFRNILPSCGLIQREKLQSWLSHKSLLVDRAREQVVERMNQPQAFHLDDERQKELDRIYARAERELAE